MVRLTCVAKSALVSVVFLRHGRAVPTPAIIAQKNGSVKVLLHIQSSTFEVVITANLRHLLSNPQQSHSIATLLHVVSLIDHFCHKLTVLMFLQYELNTSLQHQKEYHDRASRYDQLNVCHEAQAYL